MNIEKNIILCKEFSPCKGDDFKYCLYAQGDKNKCDKNLRRCPYVIRSNPFCTCNYRGNCSGKIDIKQYKNKTYTFYFCKRCKFLIKDENKTYDKILDNLNDKSLIYGDKLKELVKKVYKEKEIKNEPDYDVIVDFLENIYNSLNTRC